MTTKKYLLKLLSAALLATPLAVLAEPVYTMSFPPAGFLPLAMNNAGQVVGIADDAAAIWLGSSVTSLRPVLGESSGFAINNHGDVAGIRHNLPGSHAFAYVSGTVQDVHAALPSWTYSSWPRAINDSGQVVGTAFPMVGDDSLGFLYSGGNAQMIGTFGGSWSDPYAINKRGQVVGVATLGGGPDPYRHAFLYENGTLLDLGVLAGGQRSEAHDINDAGQVVGWSEAEPQTGVSNMRPFVYRDGSMIDLGSLGGGAGVANGINNAGIIVGDSFVAPDDWRVHAFLYWGGRMIDLNTLIDPSSGWELVSAQDINDSGQILARACRMGECATVRLDPNWRCLGRGPAGWPLGRWPACAGGKAGTAQTP